MNEEMARFIEFRALGDSFYDCGFILAGRMHTIGSDICLKIEQELQAGTLDIDIEDDEIHFIFEGVSIVFSERPERLLVIKQMLESGTSLCRERYKNSNSSGFTLAMRG